MYLHPNNKGLDTSCTICRKVDWESIEAIINVYPGYSQESFYSYACLSLHLVSNIALVRYLVVLLCSETVCMKPILLFY